jgi:hypothetical protein
MAIADEVGIVGVTLDNCDFEAVANRAGEDGAA